MAYKTIVLEREDGVGIITLNRPAQLNALSFALTTELEQAITHFEDDDGVGAIIITGAGDKAFSAGGDIHEMVKQPELKPTKRESLSFGWHLAACRKPTIGAINGLAYGGGALMSSEFDIRIGCERTSFRFLAVTYGRCNSTWTLPLIVGWPIAKELLFTGRVVEAEEALRIGLLNKLVSASELMKVAIEMGQSIATNDAKTVQTIKEILTRDIGMSWREMALNEAETVSQSLNIPPPRQAFKDFLERKAR